MHKLSDVLVDELNPETQAVVDEVCLALEWFDPAAQGSEAGLPRFGPKWGTALFHGNAECRQKVFAAVTALCRAEDGFWGASGYYYGRDQIARYDGQITYRRDEDTGEMCKVLEFPSDWLANGKPFYGRRKEDRP